MHHDSLTRYELDVQGMARHAFYHLPPGEAPAGGWPLVVALHGGGSTPRGMLHFTQLTREADRHGFIVLMPAGTGPSQEFLTWNAGRCCGHAARRQTDDIAFLATLLDDALARWKVDPGRVYATGISNGGMMCYRAAAELNDRFAAIAPVAGALVCDPPLLERGVPAIHFHGTSDEFVPYAGGRGARSLRRVDFPSVADSLSRWRTACRFDPAFDESLLFSGKEAASSQEWSPMADRHLTVTRIVHARHDEADTLVEIRIVGGGHTWPGVAPPLPMMGPTLMSLSASDMIWEFFSQFTLGQPDGARG
jgi:polyhydroxybutyrate depolymerase